MFIAVTFPFFGGRLGFFGGFAFAPTTYFVSYYQFFNQLEKRNKKKKWGHYDIKKCQKHLISIRFEPSISGLLHCTQVYFVVLFHSWLGMNHRVVMFAVSHCTSLHLRVLNASFDSSKQNPYSSTSLTCTCATLLPWHLTTQISCYSSLASCGLQSVSLKDTACLGS